MEIRKKQNMMNIEIGKLISEDLATYLKTHTSKDDRADVSFECNVSASLLTKIVYRERVVTIDNKESFIKLIMIANRNSEKKIKEAQRDNKMIQKSIFDCI